MMRLIDADALQKVFEDMANDGWNKETHTSWSRAFEESANIVDECKTIEAEPVVHCKDCKYSKMMGDTWGDCHNPRFGDGWGNYPPPSVNEDGYCAWGEKLEKEENETD